VVRINGGAIERPNQFMKVWEQLPDRQELVVDMVRGGQPLTLRYPIVDP
jgi:hypothetical protein